MNNQKLPIHVIPYEDELLSSWLLRLSKELLTKYHTFLQFFFTGADLDTRDIDLNINSKQTDKLSNITFLSCKQVELMTLKSYEPNLALEKGLRNWILTKGKVHRKSMNNFISYCPICLKTDKNPYFRKRWRLIFSIICTKCGVFLKDKCPKCSSPIDFLRLDIGRKEKVLSHELSTCSTCQYDLRQSKSVNCGEEWVENQSKIEQHLFKGYTENISYSHLFFEGMYIIMSLLNSTRPRIKNLDTYISKELKTDLVSEIGKRYNELKNMPLEIRKNILLKTYWLLNLRREELIEICSEAGISSWYIINDKKNIPYWIWESLAKPLTVKYSEWKRQYPEYTGLNSYKSLISKFN